MAMNIYKYHTGELNHKDEAHDKVPQLAWDKFEGNDQEIKKRKHIFIKDPNTAIMYVLLYTKRGQTLPEAEQAISTDITCSYNYATHIQKPFPLGEPMIAKDAFYSRMYAKAILHGRFKLGEPTISKNVVQVYLYANEVIGGRFKMGEPIIATSAKYSFLYATEVLKGPFPLGERKILNSEYFGKYMDFIKGKK